MLVWGRRWFGVDTGFKQGDVNAPLLFNIILTQWSSHLSLSRHLGSLGLTKLMATYLSAEIPRPPMYADDITLVADSEEKLQEALIIVDVVSKKTWAANEYY